MLAGHPKLRNWISTLIFFRGCDSGPTLARLKVSVPVGDLRWPHSGQWRRREKWSSSFFFMVRRRCCQRVEGRTWIDANFHSLMKKVVLNLYYIRRKGNIPNGIWTMKKIHSTKIVNNCGKQWLKIWLHSAERNQSTRNLNWEKYRVARYKNVQWLRKTVVKDLTPFCWKEPIHEDFKLRKLPCCKVQKCSIIVENNSYELNHILL